MRLTTFITRADKTIVGKCDAHELTKLRYEAFALIVQFVVVFTVISYAVYLAFENVYVAAFAGFVIALSIWFYESSSIEFIRLSGSSQPFKLLKGLMFRIFVSVVMAIFVSKNIEIILHREVIDKIVVDFEKKTNQPNTAKKNIEISDLKKVLDNETQIILKNNKILESKKTTLLDKTLQLENKIATLNSSIHQMQLDLSKEVNGFKDRNGTKIPGGYGNNSKALGGMITTSKLFLEEKKSHLISIQNSLDGIDHEIDKNETLKKNLLSDFLKEQRSIERKHKYQSHTFSESFLIKFWALNNIYNNSEFGEVSIQFSWLIKLVSMLVELIPLLTYVFFGEPLQSEYRQRKISHNKTLISAIP